MFCSIVNEGSPGYYITVPTKYVLMVGGTSKVLVLFISQLLMVPFERII